MTRAPTLADASGDSLSARAGLSDAPRRTPRKPLALASPTPARTRKLHLGHFAFMRAVVLGIGVRESWDRYLRIEGEGSDARIVRATIAWMRDEFAAAARREQRPGTARLVLFDAAGLADPRSEEGGEAPSLEAFAQARGLEDFSEAEQIAAWQAEHGAASARELRRQRLVDKQLAALRWLEDLVAQPPLAGDAVAAWLNPVLAGRLESAGVLTIAQLIERINGIGRRWYAGIPAMGETKAQRVAAWLRDHEATIGLAIGGHVELARTQLFAHELAAVVAPATEIRPLEKFVVPVDLDGSRGLYRRPQAQCLLKASNDYEAILAWLRAKRGLSPEEQSKLAARRRVRPAPGRDVGLGQALDPQALDSQSLDSLHWLASLSNTQRAYRKEAERFLLWAIVDRGKALSSMANEDCIAYREFLADPRPAARWCGARARERWSPLWRPFEGPLSAAAQRQAIAILKNLYGFLVDQNYLMGNPWSAVGVPASAGPTINAGRSFTVAQWAFVEAQVKQLSEPRELTQPREFTQPRESEARDSETHELAKPREVGVTSVNLRLAFALRLLYATGLRLSEVVAATVDALRWVEYPADSDGAPLAGWMLRVVGKGAKVREVPVPVAVIEELKAYLVSRGLTSDIEHAANRGAFLLGHASDAASRAPGLAARLAADPREGVAATTLYRQVKAFFARCAQVLREEGDAKGAERFAKASTHWLRHSHASHAIAAGVPIEIAQQNLGHASLATTTVYVTTEAKRRMRAMAGFWKI